jgi:hypothetical protein
MVNPARPQIAVQTFLIGIWTVRVRFSKSGAEVIAKNQPLQPRVTGASEALANTLAKRAKPS